MHSVRFHFLAPAAANDHLHLAAAILASSLSRQGLKCRTDAAVVTVEAFTAGNGELSTVYILLNEAMLTDGSVIGHIDDHTAVVVCTARPAQVVLQDLGRFPAGITAVDAEGIAGDEGADPITALLGGTARLVPFIDPELLGIAVWSNYDHTFPYAAHAAMRAFDLGYAQAQQALS